MANPGNFQLFVYGSLLSGFKSPAYEYISRYFDLVSEGRVKGLLFDMGDYPAAVPADFHDTFIDGELYRIRHTSEFSYALAQLDDYEGVLVEPGEQALYRRELVQVAIPGGTEVAWIYWFNGDVSGRPQIESGNLLEYIAARK
ncbi:MAG: gamma-glutamylcyclotransferase [Chitinophagaceae bacterium]|nr:MAG: gamma-glutamylcyclotransferase [Chitinophagaceae bacterium]